MNTGLNKLNQAEQYVQQNPNTLVKIWDDYFITNNREYTLHYIRLNTGEYQCDYCKGSIREKSITAKLNTQNAIEL
jgi:hypothetical protein